MYTGALIIPNLESLLEVLNSNSARRRWIITSSVEVNKLSKVSGDIVEFLENSKQELVYVGNDHESRVYLFATSLNPFGRDHRAELLRGSTLF
jgi:hypothetical protein